jgi:hypothetical protein
VDFSGIVYTRKHVFFFGNWILSKRRQAEATYIPGNASFFRKLDLIEATISRGHEATNFESKPLIFACHGPSTVQEVSRFQALTLVKSSYLFVLKNFQKDAAISPYQFCFKFPLSKTEINLALKFGCIDTIHSA